MIFLSQCSKNLKLFSLDGVYQLCYNCIKTTNTVDDTRSTIYHPIGGGLLISLNYRDSRPIYEQIKDNYKKHHETLAIYFDSGGFGIFDNGICQGEHTFGSFL